MRDIIADSIDRLLAERVTAATLAAGIDGGWDAALWSELEVGGFTAALADPDTSWSDVAPLVMATGLHQLPLPLAEVMLAGWLLARAGLPDPGGLVGVADLTPGVGDGRQAVVAWGRRCGHVLAPIGRDALGLYAVDASTTIRGANLAGEPRDHVLLDESRLVATADLAGAAAQIRTRAALVRSLQMAGASRSAVEQTVRYAGERVQFGKPLAKMQAVQQQIAAAVSELSALVAATEYAVEARKDGLEYAVAVAKITAGEAGTTVAAVAQAVHGAIGYTREYRLHHATQRLRAWSSEHGNARWWAERLGAALCRRGADGLVPTLVAGDATLIG